jgi:hypothetical protein
MNKKSFFLILVPLVLSALFLRMVCICDLYYGFHLVPGWKVEDADSNQFLQFLFTYGSSVLNILALGIYYLFFLKHKQWYQSGLFLFFPFSYIR